MTMTLVRATICLAMFIFLQGAAYSAQADGATLEIQPGSPPANPNPVAVNNDTTVQYKTFLYVLDDKNVEQPPANIKEQVYTIDAGDDGEIKSVTATGFAPNEITIAPNKKSATLRKAGGNNGASIDVMVLVDFESVGEKKVTMSGVVTFQDGSTVPKAGETVKAEVTVKVQDIAVSFLPNPVVTGYVIPVRTDPVRLPDLFTTVVATVTPKDQVANVRLKVEGKEEQILMTPPERDVQAGTLKFDIFGQMASANANGEVFIVATVNNVEKGRVPVVVVIPKTQTQTVGKCEIKNTAQRLATGGFKLGSEISCIVEIKISDQFGKPLHEVYDGTSKVVEEFKDVRGALFRAVVIAINIPDAKFENGVKLDQAGAASSFNAPTLNADDANKWVNGTLKLRNGNNAFAVGNISGEGSATQIIRVHGHTVTPDYRRTAKLKAENHPPVPFEFESKPIE